MKHDFTLFSFPICRSCRLERIYHLNHWCIIMFLRLFFNLEQNQYSSMNMSLLKFSLLCSEHSTTGFSLILTSPTSALVVPANVSAFTVIFAKPHKLQDFTELILVHPRTSTTTFTPFRAHTHAHEPTQTRTQQRFMWPIRLSYRRLSWINNTRPAYFCRIGRDSNNI